MRVYFWIGGDDEIEYRIFTNSTNGPDFANYRCETTGPADKNLGPPKNVSMVTKMLNSGAYTDMPPTELCEILLGKSRYEDDDLRQFDITEFADIWTR